MLSREETGIFEGAAAQLGIALDPTSVDQLGRYRHEVLQWSRRLNLVSRSDEDRIVAAHFVDSLRPIPYLPARSGIRIADLGSGAGFPGIILKIVRPDLVVTLIESSQKRRVFLAHVPRELGLAGIEAIGERAEDMAEDPTYAGAFAVVVARAAGRLSDLLTWSAPLLEPGGSLIAYKPADPAAEINASLAIAGELGFSLPEVLAEPTIPWRRGTLVMATMERPPPAGETDG